MNAARLLAIALATSLVSGPVLAQRPESPQARIAVQRDAMARFAYLDGVWRGPAVTTLPDGTKHTIVQTERIGPFLDGSVKVFEGRGYEADGTVSFNALGTVSYDAAKKVYTLHSNAQGYVGDYVLTPTADGFAWEIPAGPMTLRYVATIKDGMWRETGDRILPGKEPVRFFEMNLKRIGDTTWPAGGAISPR
ncbi:MAG: DUF1579 domain-containing protein [Telluria sp.]